MKRNVCVVGLKYEKNIGDPIISETFNHLILNQYPDIEYSYIDLKVRKSTNDLKNLIGGRI